MPNGHAPKIRHTHLFGHPKGLTVLFTTEMWERFSYAGMSSLLALYLVNHALVPGRVEAVIGYDAVKAAMEFIYGARSREAFVAQLVLLFTGIAYSAPIVGGYVADRFFGQRITAVAGALLMAAGHFLMMFEATLFFALACLILGIGAFKPNVSTQVGALYADGDERRVRAYSIYYLGINIGTFLAPLTAGTLGQTVGWHYGFGTAGVAMLVATAIYLAGLRHLPPDEVRHARLARPPAAPLTPSEKQAVGRAPVRLRARLVLLGVLQPAGRDDPVLGRAIHRPAGQSRFLARPDPDRLVSLDRLRGDLRAHAGHHQAVGMAGQARHRAVDHRQDGDRVRLHVASPTSCSRSAR